MKTQVIKSKVSFVFIFFLMLGLSFQPKALFASSSTSEIDFKTAIVEVAKQNIPAVVHIEVTQSQEVANPFMGFQNDPFFGQLFGNRQLPRKFKRELKGLGSGMIIDNNKGYVLTNNHVVAGATDIEVLLSNGKRYKSKLVGTDPKTDLAVIQIDSKGPFPQIKFGDSDKLEVGSWVVAIGHPRGLDQTVTQGIISAKHRRGVTDPNSFEDFLQTDTAINPGNSGGPLLNLKGEVIGVNAVIMSQSGGFEGIGFAIPSNMAIHVAKSLIAHGKVERGWLGVSIQDINQDLAKSMDLNSTKGALVSEVVDNGPADKAGMEHGDVIIYLNSKKINNSNELRNAVAASSVGKTIAVSVKRKGKTKKLRVKIGSYEDAAKRYIASAEKKLGAKIRPLTDKEKEKYNLENQGGVVIDDLDTFGVLRNAGFEVDDIILGINRQPIKGTEDLANIVNMLKPNQAVAVLALDHRSGRSGYVQIMIN